MERLAENYHTLIKLSDTGADIFGSEVCAELLRPIPHFGTALLRMQLEQERFFRLLASGDACGNLRERLSPYTAEECRGILLYMLEELDRLRGIRWTEQRRLRTVRLPLSELEARTASAAESAARLLCADIAVPPGMEPAGSSAAALAVAVYAEDPGGVPEQIAAVSAAAPAGSAVHLVVTLLFQLLSPLCREETASVQARLLPLLTLFLTCLSLLAGCALPVPDRLPVLTAPDEAMPDLEAPIPPEASETEDGEPAWEQPLPWERA